MEIVIRVEFVLIRVDMACPMYFRNMAVVPTNLVILPCVRKTRSNQDSVISLWESVKKSPFTFSTKC